MRFAVIGSPVSHSRSPAMHEAAYRALGLDHTYEKLETGRSEVPHRVASLRRGELDGLNVTVPHKIAALDLVDELDPSARAAGAANTIVRLPSGVLVAHNTDMPALAGEIAVLGDVPVGPGVGLVLGTGGAARAAVGALAALGLRRIVVRGREMARAEALTDRMQPLVAARLVAEPLAPGKLDAEISVVVQATTCGMSGGPPGALVADAVDWAAVPADARAIDVVYVPRTTPFLAAAGKRGLASTDGLGMLARQGALAFELWLGMPAPLAVMRAALD